MPSQADTEATLLKPATRTGILAIFMTQAEKESATPPAFDLLKRPGFVEALYLPARVWPLSVLIFNPSYPAGGKVSEFFL
jgi:hypothetical protein